ncbi:MAG: preprotein translocase subunit YajC [Clostridiales bacterium]|nr:preprotein translocase subunit YajC [Clostridiales bacterium]
MELIYKLLGVGTAIAEEAAVATEELPAGAGFISLIGTFFPLIIMFALMYFLMIRPEKKRKKKEKAMLDALKRGDRICTIGGIYGTIMDIKDDTITLAVGRDNMSMVITRWAVRSVEDVTIENESESLN